MQITDQFKPLKSESVAAGYEVRKIYLSFHGPKGSTFGQELAIEVKVVLNDQASQSLKMEELFRAAIYMSETLNVGSFDDCVEALKACNGDQNAAVQHLFDRV